VRARDHLHAAPAVGDELGKEGVFGRRAERVAARVGDHGDAAGLRDPLHGVTQPRPAVRHIAGLAVGQEAPENLVRVAAGAGLDDVAREVGARDQLRVAHVLEGSLEGASDAHARQFIGHLARTRLAAAARGRQPAHQRLVLVVKAQAHDVDRDTGKRDGNLHTREAVEAELVRGLQRLALAPDLVVIGQGPELHAVRLGALGHHARGERTVRHGGVAVQIRVREMGQRCGCSGLRGRGVRRRHPGIVGSPQRGFADNGLQAAAGCVRGRAGGRCTRPP
jgi:hypothetical protein